MPRTSYESEPKGLSPWDTPGTGLAASVPMRQPFRLAPEAYRAPQRCFVTFATWHREPVLADPYVADLVVDATMSAAATHQTEVTAYCLMPDHVHLLLTAETDSPDVRKLIEGAKQRSGFSYRRHFSRPLWQPSYFDRTLRSDEATPSVVAYLLNNPVRAGYVRSPREWPFWGSSRWSRDALLEFACPKG